MKKYFIALMLLVASASYGYQPYEVIKGGYRDEQLSQDTFKIQYLDDGYYYEITEELAKCRAAEVVKSQGYNYFTIHSRKDIKNKYGKWCTLIVKGFQDEPQGVESYIADDYIKKIPAKRNWKGCPIKNLPHNSSP